MRFNSTTGDKTFVALMRAAIVGTTLAWAAKKTGKKIAIVSDTSDYGAANTQNFEKF